MQADAVLWSRSSCLTQESHQRVITAHCGNLHVNGNSDGRPHEVSAVTLAHTGGIEPPFSETFQKRNNTTYHKMSC